jgi:hypothetical protein
MHRADALPPRDKDVSTPSSHGLDGDPGVRAYASNARRSQIFRRGDGVNLQLKLEELGEETSNFKRAES